MADGKVKKDIRYRNQLRTMADSHAAGTTRSEHEQVPSEGTTSAKVAPSGAASETLPTEHQSDQERVSHTRVATVVLLLRELDSLRREIFSAQDFEKAKGSRDYRDFLTFRVVKQDPRLKDKVIAVRERRRLIGLALDLAAAQHHVTEGTIRQDWKKYKPAEFRRKQSGQ